MVRKWTLTVVVEVAVIVVIIGYHSFQTGADPLIRRFLGAGFSLRDPNDRYYDGSLKPIRLPFFIRPEGGFGH